MSEQKKPVRYTPEFRQSAVKLAVESDQPISQIAKELGVNENTLHTWISKYHGPVNIDVAQLLDWETLYRCMAYGMQPTVPIPNDSS